VTCLRIQFHNDSGLLGPDENVRCETGQPDDGTTPRAGPNTSRMLSLREAFSKR
jgi:hypothetical protein